MKILLTGMTSRACNAQKFTRGKIWNVPETFKDLWEKDDIEVEQRPVCVGESLLDNDLVFLVVAPSGSVHSTFALNGLYALATAVANYVPLVIYFEDWRIKPNFSNARSMVRFGEKQLHKRIGDRRLYYRTPIDAVHQHQATILEGARMFNDDVWNHAVPLVPKFNGWGDLDILGKTMDGARTHLRSVDPTPLILHWTEHPGTPPLEKSRRWVLAALPNHTHWIDRLKLEWPLDSYGSKYATHGRLMTEDDVFQTYTGHWGVLSPPYYHAGSGWCRARTVFAAKAGSILYPGPVDGAMLGNAFEFTPQAIEAMSDVDLRYTAACQQASIIDRLVTDPSFTMAQFDAIFEEAQEKVLNA